MSPITTPCTSTSSAGNSIGDSARVRRHQPHLAAVLVEALQRALFAADQRDHRLAGARRLARLEHDDVAVDDVVVDHRVAGDAQREALAARDQIRRDRDRVGSRDGLDRPARGDAAEQRDLDACAANAPRARPRSSGCGSRPSAAGSCRRGSARACEPWPPTTGRSARRSPRGSARSPLAPSTRR